jgi:hypothetical protein
MRALDAGQTIAVAESMAARIGEYPSFLVPKNASATKFYKKRRLADRVE